MCVTWPLLNANRLREAHQEYTTYSSNYRSVITENVLPAVRRRAALVVLSSDGPDILSWTYRAVLGTGNGLRKQPGKEGSR